MTHLDEGAIVSLRDGALVGGLYVGPPGTAKAFTQLLQKPEPAAVRRFAQAAVAA